MFQLLTQGWDGLITIISTLQALGSPARLASNIWESQSLFRPREATSQPQDFGLTPGMTSHPSTSTQSEAAQHLPASAVPRLLLILLILLIGHAYINVLTRSGQAPIQLSLSCNPQSVMIA